MSRIGDKLSTFVEAPAKSQLLSIIAIGLAIYAIGLMAGAMIGMRAIGGISNGR